MAQNYQAQGPFLRAEPGTNGAAQHLKAWWIDIASLMDILTNTPQCDGLRAYIVLQDRNQENNAITPYHSLVLIGTQPGSNGIHDNFRPANSMVIDFVEPCPSTCTDKNPLIP